MNRQLVPILGVIFLVVCTSNLTAQNGLTVKQIPSRGNDLNAIYFADSKRGWVGGDGGYFAYSEDSGESWVESRIGTRAGINDIYFVSHDKGFVLAGNTIFSTTDGGHMWQQSHTFSPEDFKGADIELYSLRFDGKKRGWVVGSVSRRDRVEDSILAITRDGGATWQVLHAPSRQELIHIDFVDEKRGWIVGAGGAILHTEDAGETWKRQLSGVTETLYHVDFRNSKQGIAVGERGTILMTEDAGETWIRVFSPAHATLLSVQFVSEDNVWIVGRSGVILRSGDGGRTWAEQESGTRQNLYALFIKKKEGWAVGSVGLLMRYVQ